MKYWPAEIKEKARQLASQGMPRGDIAAIIGVPQATLAKWTRHLGIQPVKYGEETRKKAVDLYGKGLSRPQIAHELGINIKTITGWIPPSQSSKFRPYPIELKRKARSMARQGMEKGEISAKLSVGYCTIARWTRDITNRHSHVNGRYFLILARLAGDGYFISQRSDSKMFRFLKRYVHVKSVLIGKLAVFYLPGNERKAFFGLIKRQEIQPLTERKANLLKEAFGVRE